MAGGNFLATAYGPPWNAMNGSGVTSTGVALRGQVPVIAVDPSVIPYGSIVRVSNSPLGPDRLFVAADTGGAIRGNHIDFYVAGGRGAQLGWGSKQIRLQVVRQGNGPGSVHSALAQLAGSQAVGSSPVAGGGGGTPSVSVPVTTQTFDRAGFGQARDKFLAGQFLSQTAKTNAWGTGTAGANVGANPLFSPGLLSTTAPNPADYVRAQTTLQRIVGGTPLAVHPAVAALSPGGNIAGGFLPRGARYMPGRKDQGRDGQTNPGGPIVADGNGFVVNVLSDPNGFGPRYPVIHFTSGRYKGRTLYFGHTLAVVRPGQRVASGQVISRTGTSGVGNATVPGWFEIGYADSGSPGPLGQPAPF